MKNRDGQKSNLHVVVTSEAIPVEYTFIPGSTHDLDDMKPLPLNLPLSILKRFVRT
jgi:hypothetical protein